MWGGIAFSLLIAIFALTGQMTYASYTTNVFIFYIFFVWGFIRRFSFSSLETFNWKKILISCGMMLCFGLFRVAGWYFLDDTNWYILIVSISNLGNSIAYFIFINMICDKIDTENIVRKIKKIDGISYEFYLIHALFISGATSIYGFLGKSPWEIVFMLFLTYICSVILHMVCEKIMKRKNI